MKIKDITVLMTAAGSPSMPGLVKCIKHNGERNIKIIGTDMKDDATIKQFVDIFYKVPASNAPGYIDALFDICKSEKVNVLIPTISSELEDLQIRRKEFESIGTLVSVSEGNGLSIANNKIKLYEFMKLNCMRVPKFIVINSADDFISACKSIGYPNKGICVKMKDGSGSRGIRIIDPTKSRFEIFINEKPNSLFTTIEDMDAILHEVDQIPELLIMEYLSGTEYSVDLLANHGDVKYIVGRESNVITASIPQEATLVKNDEAYVIANEIVEKLKLDGNINLDFKFDEEGHPQLLEINPRLSATLSVIAAGGINLIYLRLKQLLGEELPELDIKYGVKLKRRYHELFCDAEGKEVCIN